MSRTLISDFFDILDQARRAYSRILEPVCAHWDLTRNEVDVLLFLYNNPGYDRAADIVTRRGMTKSHVSISVAALAERGLLTRSFSEKDRRTAHLTLTETGTAAAAEARVAQEAYFARIHGGIPGEDMEVFRSVTQRIWENIRNL